jgi:hypothetical protein
MGLRGRAALLQPHFSHYFYYFEKAIARHRQIPACLAQ